jgi:hypothetical protein
MTDKYKREIQKFSPKYTWFECIQLLCIAAFWGCCAAAILHFVIGCIAP